MKYIKLGNSELEVSRIAMGCRGFGDPAGEPRRQVIDLDYARDVVMRGVEMGINFFDTALADQGGSSEKILGKILEEFVLRDDVVVATKFLPRGEEEIRRGISGQQHIENSIEQSLQNLGMDYVDLYIYQNWDWHTPLYDIMDGLNRIVKAGKARYIGIANCFAWQLVKANSLAEKEGFAKFVVQQGPHNLLYREEEREMVPYCLEEHIARAADPERKVIERAAELAENRGVSVQEISLAWLLTKAAAAIVDATRIEQIEGAARAVDLELTPQEIQYLEFTADSLFSC